MAIKIKANGGVYSGLWKCLEDVRESFADTQWDEHYTTPTRVTPVPENLHVLVADYTDEDYSGSAFVLYEQDGKLFEVNGSHCSCYGLEDQWHPEAVEIEELRRRMERQIAREVRIQRGEYVYHTTEEYEAAVSMAVTVLDTLDDYERMAHDAERRAKAAK